MVIALYAKHLHRVWIEFRSSTDISTPTALEIGTIAGILYILPIICIAVYIKMAFHVDPPTTVVAAQSGPLPSVFTAGKPKDLSELSNLELKNAVHSFTTKMRATEVAYNNQEVISDDRASHQRLQNDDQPFLNDNRTVIQIYAQLNREWNVKYRSRSAEIYKVLCSRIGLVPADTMSGDTLTEIEAKQLLTNGTLAGVMPMSALADYLDDLANQLDLSETP